MGTTILTNFSAAIVGFVIALLFTVIRAIVLWIGFNLTVSYTGFEPFTFWTALGIALVVNVTVDTITRLRN
jgi:hypothetical protein